MIPSWRKRKALERKRRDYSVDQLMQSFRDNPIPATYCPNCGHRFDKTGHKFSCST
jgi:hypothetical protein